MRMILGHEDAAAPEKQHEVLNNFIIACNKQAGSTHGDVRLLAAGRV